MDPLNGRCFATLPPYHAFNAVGTSSPRLPEGAVVALRVSADPHEISSLPAAVHTVRRRFWLAPTVLWLAEGSPPDLLHQAYSSISLGVRAVLFGDALPADVLRPACTRPISLGSSVLEWLDLRGVRIPPVLVHLLGQVVQQAPLYAELRKLLGDMCVPESSLRLRCQRVGLPAPRHWHQMGRALHAALAVQAETGTPLARLALDLGYADHSALSQLCRRNFALRPGELRGTLGWEWLMERWCRQKIH